MHLSDTLIRCSGNRGWVRVQQAHRVRVSENPVGFTCQKNLKSEKILQNQSLRSKFLICWRFRDEAGKPVVRATEIPPAMPDDKGMALPVLPGEGLSHLARCSMMEEY